LILLGGAAISYSLPGCGGGDGGTPVGDSSRTAISGNLEAQYNQFSTIAQRITDTWMGSSPAMDALRDMPGRASRAPADVKIAIQALNIGLNANRAAYERLCNLALQLDDIGAAAKAVTTNNSLSGSNAVNNEQWLMTMIAQNYAAVKVTGTLFIMQLVAGLPEARAWALARTTDAQKLAAYGLVADVFNTWVNNLCAAGNITPNTAWKLDLSNAVTAANAATKLNQIDTIIPLLPFSPGYRKPGAQLSQTDDESLGATGIQNFAQSFTGALAQLALSGVPLTATFPQTVDTTKTTYNVATRLGNTGVGATLAAMEGGLTAAQTTIDGLLLPTDGATWPGVTGDSASNQVQIVAKTYGFIQALVTALITTQSALGSLITGAQALAFLDALETTVAQCGSPLQKALWAAVEIDRLALRGQQLFNGSVPTTREVNVARVSSVAEIDQLSASGVSCSTKITVTTPDICPMDPRVAEVPHYRIIISGLQKDPDCPRTFRNVLICIAGLLYSVAQLYTDTVNAAWEDDATLKFCSSDFARVLRREPQAAFAEIPAITSAQLLCSGIGYIPSKSITPQNLATIPTLPDLQFINGLVGGVPINVH
jgi:hypothetical protein